MAAGIFPERGVNYGPMPGLETAKLAHPPRNMDLLDNIVCQLNQIEDKLFGAKPSGSVSETEQCSIVEYQMERLISIRERLTRISQELDKL